MGRSPFTVSITPSVNCCSRCLPDCFIPAPKVTSAVIRLTPTQQPPVAVSDEGFFFRVVRAAFSMRRKTLANGLANGFSGQLTKGKITELIQSCGFAPTVRGNSWGWRSSHSWMTLFRGRWADAQSSITWSKAISNSVLMWSSARE